MEEKEKPFENPIDADKITDSPHDLTYGHHRGSAVINPLDKGRTKGLAMEAMYEQTDVQLLQIQQQVALLAAQAKAIQRRKEISEQVYKADMPFKPLIGHSYYLYARPATAATLLSMIAPQEWGRSQPFTYLAKVRLLADHTWDVLEDRLPEE